MNDDWFEWLLWVGIGLCCIQIVTCVSFLIYMAVAS